MNESTAVRDAPIRADRFGVGRGWSVAGGMRGVMVGALPLVIEAISPNRVTLSFVVTVFYVVGALILVRPRAVDRPVLIYAAIAAAFVALSLLRMEMIDPLNAAQREYGLGKATYFIEVAIPLSVAAALLVSSLNDLRPAVVVFLFVGVAVAFPTVILRNAALFGVGRYTTLGNLIAIAGLLLCQFWIIRNFRVGIVLALIAFGGVLITQSRQSVAAVAIGLAVTGVYWLVADRVRAETGKPSVVRRLWMLPTVLYGAVVAIVLVWVVLVLQTFVNVPAVVKDPVLCNCIAGRLVDIVTNPGGRNVLIEQGWNLFAGHPIFGAGLGAFVGLTQYPYPHNIPLEVGGEMGLIGIVVLLVPLVIGWLRLAVAGIKASSQAVAAAIMIVLVYAVVANLAGDLASERGLWVFGFIVLKLGWRLDPAEARI